MALVVKSMPANAGAIRDLGSIPGSVLSPGGGLGNPLQCSCLQNPMDRGTCELQSIGFKEMCMVTELTKSRLVMVNFMY